MKYLRPYLPRSQSPVLSPPPTNLVPEITKEMLWEVKETKDVIQARRGGRFNNPN